jgi:hypothetical protein
MSDGTDKKIGKRIGDTSDLPPELLKHLNITKLDDVEERIISTLRTRYEGIASIDEILVGLYRDFQYIPEDRRTFASKLYRMCKAGHLESVSGKKGVFRIK